MRRLHTEFRLGYLLAAIAAVPLGGGCGSGDGGDTNVKAGSGAIIKRTAEQTAADQQRAQGYAKMGAAMNAQQSEWAKEIAAAKARTGGK